MVPSPTHLAKFSEAVTGTLWIVSRGIDSEWNVLPQEFLGLLEIERGVVDVNKPYKELVKKVIKSKVNSAGSGDQGCLKRNHQ